MNWHAVLGSIISGAAVSWPAIVFGYWLNRARTRQHIDRVTAAQTQEIKQALGAVPPPGGDV